MPIPTITIAGRSLRAMDESTLLHDCYMRDKLGQATAKGVHLRDGEAESEFARRMASALWADGLMFDLLAGTFVPADVRSLDWTPTLAAETADFLKHVADPVAKRQIHSLAGGLIAGFYSAEIKLSNLTPQLLAALDGAGLVSRA